MDVFTQDDLDYMAAECKQPHDDSSTCLPSWDGFDYICTYRFMKEYKEKVRVNVR